MFFRTEDGEVVALEDRCCHRSAPLSAGRIRGSEIECGYHGLRFDRTGACVRVPSQELVPPGAAVRRYPAVERSRWVWVWMGEPDLADADLAMVEAQARTLARFPHAPTIDVAADYPTIQARNLLARLIEEERRSNAA